MPAATSTSLPVPVGGEHLDREDRGLRRDPGLGQAVALDLRHGARDMRAMAVVVRRIAAARDHVPARQQATGEVGRRRHAGVDDRDDDARAAGQGPGRAGPDGVESPLLRAAGIGPTRNARRRRDGSA